MMSSYFASEPCSSCDGYGGHCPIELSDNLDFIETCRKNRMELREHELKRSMERQEEIMRGLRKVINLLGTEFEKRKNFPGDVNC